MKLRKNQGVYIRQLLNNVILFKGIIKASSKSREAKVGWIFYAPVHRKPVFPYEIFSTKPHGCATPPILRAITNTRTPRS